MRLAERVFPGNLRRSQLTVLGFVVAFVLGSYKAASFIIAGDTTSLGLAAMAVVVCALVVAILND
jgi:hypothetical protein